MRKRCRDLEFDTSHNSTLVDNKINERLKEGENDSLHPCGGAQIKGGDRETVTTVALKEDEPGSSSEHAAFTGHVETVVEEPRPATKGFPVEEERDDSAEPEIPEEMVGNYFWELLFRAGYKPW